MLAVTPILELRNATYRYASPIADVARRQSFALEGLELTVRAGESLAILGANGAGKSTLLGLLNGSHRITGGQLYFDGVPFDYGRKNLDRLRQSVAMVLQEPDDQLFAGTVRQDVSFGPMNLGLEEASVRERVERILEAFKLSEVAEQAPHQLSHGQRKRVAIAGALALEPRVLVLDEPTAGLDGKGIDALVRELETLRARGMALVFSTHDLDFAHRLAERFLVLNSGSTLASGGREVLGLEAVLERAGLRVPSFLRGRALVPSQHGGARLPSGDDERTFVDASASINPLGMPLWVRQEVSRSLSSIQHYPDPRSTELTTAIARANRCGIESVVVGNGSSELLAWLPYVVDRARWVVAVPSFGEYLRAPRLAGCQVVELPLSRERGFAIDWDQLDDALMEPSVVILGHPNNPTGRLLDVAQFHAFRLRHPRSYFVVDEAFGDFVEGFESVWLPSAENLLVLRSLTKILAIPGLRLGYALASPVTVQHLQGRLPPWSVNGLAQRLGVRWFSEPSFVKDSRQRVTEWKGALAAKLRKLPLTSVVEAAANWVLVELPLDAPGATAVAERCFVSGVALRSCSDFAGLGERWLRIAVRNDEQNQKVFDALANALGVTARPSKGRPLRAIMLQGCSSDAGKSILTTALCRCLREDGYRVAPFKAQNMSNNSGVARDGGEVGRAQILQAFACGIEPDTRMNPVLLKPTSDLGAQVVLRGQAIGHRKALEYETTKARCLETALEAFDELAAEYDVIVCEGAGSSGEMNLRERDIVNMGFVSCRPMPVLLVGDIDRGGVYASFVGHLEVMSEADRNFVRGFLVNRFRGDIRLLAEAHRSVSYQTGRPVLGVVPYLTDHGLPDEDRLSLMSGPRRWGNPEAPLQIAAVSGPHVSNFTDLDALAFEQDVCVRLVERAEELGQPDLIVLLGTKNTLGDLQHFHRIELSDALLCAHARGSQLLGICGGLQMLGLHVLDEAEVESQEGSATGLGLLPITTRMAKEKTVRQVLGRHVASGLPVKGYEIHHGVSELEHLEPWLLDERGAVLGARTKDGRVYGTYLHGLFDADAFRRNFLDDLRERKGLTRLGGAAATSDLEPRLAALAKVFRESVDLPAIYRLMGLDG